MRSLFAKIFLWFWLATIFIIGATLVLMSLIAPYSPVREEGRQVRRLARDGQWAVRILDQQGPEALRAFLEERERRPGVRYFLFDENSEALAGMHPSSDMKDLADRAKESGVTEFKRLDKSILLAQSVYDKGDRYYIIAAELPQRPRFSPFWRFLNPPFSEHTASRYLYCRQYVLLLARVVSDCAGPQNENGHPADRGG